MVNQELVIYLHANDLMHPSWVIVDMPADAASSIKKTVYRGDPEYLAQLAFDKTILVLIPAEDVLLTTVTLPKMNRSRLLQALPYALEDQLINDIETSHFAVSDEQTDGSLMVGIVAHEKMQQWLTLLQLWHVQADVFIPASLALPFHEREWHVALSDIAIVRIGPFQGFASDKTNLPLCLQIASSTTPSLRYIHICNSTNHAFASMLNLPVEVKEDFVQPEQLIAHMACCATQAISLNLLQGTYATKKSKLPHREKIWRITAYLAVVWILLLFLYPTVSYFIFSSRINHLDAQIEQIYKRNFPEANSVVAPKLRMEEKLQKLMAQAGENQLLLLLGYIGKGILEVPHIKLKRFDFQNSQLTLELTATSSDAFTAFTDFLTQQGLSVKQQNATLTGERVNATLLIES